MSSKTVALIIPALALLIACAPAAQGSAESQLQRIMFPNDVPIKVSFTRNGAQKYPSVPVHSVVCYKMINHMPGTPDRVFKDKTPTRPYVVIGTLHFNKTWYYDGDIQELLDQHVAQVGGDDILLYENVQIRGLTTFDDSVKKKGNWYHQSMDAIVIKYTDNLLSIGPAK